MTEVHVAVCALYSWKAGNARHEYEDAWRVRRIGGAAWAIRCAVADAATEASFSRSWARKLTSAFVRKPFLDSESLRGRISRLSTNWGKEVWSRDLAWYAAKKARRGAFATLLGVQASLDRSCPVPSGPWAGIAAGDSCLFQIRQDALVRSFPTLRYDEFGDSPVLVSSNLKRNDGVWSRVLVECGEWQLGDCLIFATDALAAWFVRESEQGRQPWQTLRSLATARHKQTRFRAWVDEQRMALTLKNDDTTCVIIELRAG